MKGYELIKSLSIEFDIDLIPNAQPEHHALRYLPALKYFLDEELGKLEKLGVIRWCFSE